MPNLTITIYDQIVPNIFSMLCNTKTFNLEDRLRNILVIFEKNVYNFHIATEVLLSFTKTLVMYHKNITMLFTPHSQRLK
jgi:hypothetical protein